MTEPDPFATARAVQLRVAVLGDLLEEARAARDGLILSLSPGYGAAPGYGVNRLAREIGVVEGTVRNVLKRAERAKSDAKKAR